MPIKHRFVGFDIKSLLNSSLNIFFFLCSYISDVGSGILKRLIEDIAKNVKTKKLRGFGLGGRGGATSS